MSRGRIAQASRRYPDAQRRARRYAQSAYGRRSTTLPPHLLPGVTGRGRRSSSLKPRLLLAGFVLVGAFTLFLAVSFVATTVAAVQGTLIAYDEVNGDLPDAGDVFVNTWQTSRIYDRDGNLLQEVDDPLAGWRTFVPLDEVSLFLIDATIAAEDATYWTHHGVEPFAIGRGLFINVTGAGSSGGSTITQQLVRSLFPDAIGYDYSYTRKFREALAAVELERRYGKVDILTMYLNQIFYGSRSYGIEAAAQTYFDKHAADLTLAEASLLAGVPQLPTAYNPAINFELAKRRQGYVLDQMVRLGYVTRAEADAAAAEILTIRTDRSGRINDNPHFTIYVQQYVIEHFGEDALYRGGLQITTSIDSDFQDEAERIVREQVNRVREYNVTNGATVVMVPHTGEILAMVGSANFDDPLISGQVNITTSPQQPGSTMKPIVYAAAFEQARWNPGTMVLDAPFQRDTAIGLYEPQNFTGSFYGAVPVRSALANSLNIPALKAAETIGVDSVMEMAQRMGMVNSFDRSPSEYGLSLALGGAEIQMTELTNAYSTFANLGRYVPISPILKITDAQGNVLYELDRQRVLEDAEVVVQPEIAYQVTHMLTDNPARHMLFGQGNIFELTQQELDRETAAKSGTTNDIRDTWVMGYTTGVAIGVWTGNTDNSPMRAVPGVDGPGAIWNELMTLVHGDERYAAHLAWPNGQPPPDEFPRPPGIYEGQICAATGHAPAPGARTRTEVLARGNEPSLRCDQLSAYQQRDLDQAMRDLGDGRFVGGGVGSIREFQAEAAGSGGGGGRINPTSDSQPVNNQSANPPPGPPGGAPADSDPDDQEADAPRIRRTGG